MLHERSQQNPLLTVFPLTQVKQLLTFVPEQVLHEEWQQVLSLRRIKPCLQVRHSVLAVPEQVRQEGSQHMLLELRM